MYRCAPIPLSMKGMSFDKFRTSGHGDGVLVIGLFRLILADLKSPHPHHLSLPPVKGRWTFQIVSCCLLSWLFVVIVRAFPGLQAFGRVAIVGLEGFPQVLDSNDKGNQ